MQNQIENKRLVGRVGFGCVGLTAISDKQDALRLLERAYDAGIRHYDTARAYGMGRSERILGEFARTRRDKITITTKFGITPPSYVKSVPFLSGIKRTLKKLPFLDRRVRQAVSSGSSMGNFDCKTAQQSLDASLKALKTDYIDFWLLHEATMDMATSSELLEFLVSRRSAGQIRHIGIGSAYDKIDGKTEALPEEIDILQFENNILSPRLDSFKNVEQRFIISHSALLPAKAIVRGLIRDQTRISTFKNKHGFDLSEVKVVVKLLLAWALESNPKGCVLFGSTSPQHLEDNFSVLGDSRITKKLIIEFQDTVRSRLSC